MKHVILRTTMGLAISLFAVSALASHSDSENTGSDQWGHYPAPPQCPPFEPPMPTCSLHLRMQGDFEIYVVSINKRIFKEFDNYDAAAEQVYKLRQDGFCK